MPKNWDADAYLKYRAEEAIVEVKDAHPQESMPGVAVLKVAANGRQFDHVSLTRDEAIKAIRLLREHFNLGADDA